MKSWRKGNPAVIDWLRAILWGGILAPVGGTVALILLYYVGYYVGVLTIGVTDVPVAGKAETVMLGVVVLSIPVIGTFAAKGIIDDHMEW